MTTENLITLSNLSFLICKMSINKDVYLTSWAFGSSTKYPVFKTSFSHHHSFLVLPRCLWAFLLNHNGSFKCRSSSGCSHHDFLPLFYTYSLGNVIHTYILSYICADESQNIKRLLSRTPSCCWPYQTDHARNRLFLPPSHPVLPCINYVLSEPQNLSDIQK